MDTRRDKLKDLLEQALALAPEERDAFLDTACRADADLRAELTSLLRAYEQAPAFFDDFTEAIHPHTSDATDPLLNRTVSHYRILEKLGSGGMGVVYKALDTSLGRTVALKFLPPYLSSDETAKQRFMQEARAASALDHTNIGTIYEIAEHNGQLFIAMAYYEGETLKAKIARGPLPVAEAMDYAVQLAEGLGRAHEAGIVHRDVKPANVLVTRRGRVKLLDFGIAKIQDASLTAPGSTPGTVAYMSPEQAGGEQIDHRTDLWSLGVVLYEMLTGRQPFQGDRSEVILNAIRNEAPPALENLRKDVPMKLTEVVVGLMQKDLSKRYQTAAEIVANLETIRVGGNIVRSRPLLKRPRFGVTIGIGLGFVLAALMFFLSYESNQTAPLSSNEAGQPLSGTGHEIRTIAVLPFNVHGSAELNFLREGLPTLVSLNLDALSGLASVDYNALLGYAAELPERPIDPDLGQQTALRFQADYFILGTLIDVGGVLRMDAALYSKSGEREIVKQVEMSRIEELQTTVDELTLGLVADKLDVPVPEIAGSGIAGVPFEAITHYLKGEAALRLLNGPDARSSFGRAVELDSSFALAWYRLASSWTWGSGQSAEKHDAALKVAAKLSGSLAPATDAIIRSRHFQNIGDFHRADSLLRYAISLNPNNPDAWYNLADLIFHQGPFNGIPKKQAQGPFEKALFYYPGSNEFSYHLFDIYMLQDNPARAESLLVSQDRDDGILSLLVGAMQQQNWMADSSTVSGVRDVLTRIPNAILYLSRFPTFLEQAATLFPPSYGAEWTDAADYIQGRYARQIQRLTDDGIRWKWEPLALVNTLVFVPLSEADHQRMAKVVTDWHADTLFSVTARGGKGHVYEEEDIELIDLFAAGVASWRLGDITRAQDMARRLQENGTFETENKFGLVYGYMLAALLSMDDVQKALDLLEKADINLGRPGGGTYWYRNRQVRFLRAELLFQLGDYENALKWYETLEDYMLATSFLLGPRTFRKAQCFDALGRTDEAIRGYDRFIKLWEEADPALQIWVEEARSRRSALLKQ